MARVASADLVQAYAEVQSLEKVATAWHLSRTGVKARLLRAGVLLRPRGRPRSALATMLGEIAAMKKEAQCQP